MGASQLTPIRLDATTVGVALWSYPWCVRGGVHDPQVRISNSTIAMLASPFERGNGPSHSAINLIWSSADAEHLLLAEKDYNKMDRVLYGLRALQDPRLDDSKVRQAVADLAARLIDLGLLDEDVFKAALLNDGLSLQKGDLVDVVPRGEPADRLSDYLSELLGDDERFSIARNHYIQGNKAYDRADWEAANAQYRSACDAVFDELAHMNGCPANKTGGAARKWLQAEGLLEGDEADLTKAFMTLAGKNGSHAGLSDAAECQLRRHFSTALATYAISKLGR